MIEILMTSHGEPERDTYTFSSCGHSRPEVCAAVSGLVQGVAAYLVSLQHECGECVVVDVMQSEGKIRMDVALLVDDPCLRTTLHTALSVLEIGIQQIQYSVQGSVQSRCPRTMDPTTLSVGGGHPGRWTGSTCSPQCPNKYTLEL